MTVHPSLGCKPKISEPFAQISISDNGHRLLQIKGHRIDQLCDSFHFQRNGLRRQFSRGVMLIFPKETGVPELLGKS
jgi:hypothetical protein